MEWAEVQDFDEGMRKSVNDEVQSGPRTGVWCERCGIRNGLHSNKERVDQR